MLDAIIDRQIRLIDYEKIQEHGTGKRKVAFGKGAGVAGAIDMPRAVYSKTVESSHVYF